MSGVDGNWSFLAGMAALASAAYGDEAEIKAELPAGFQFVEGSYRSFSTLVTLGGVVVPAVAHMYAARGEDNQLVILFRGTNGVGDLSVDINFALEVLLFGYSPSLQSYAELFVDSIREIISQNSSAEQIVFAGHSLGGMVAEQVTQWFYDPTDPHGLSTEGRAIIGVGIGSPGVIDAEDAPDGHFLHITRAEDQVGRYQPGYHIGPTLLIEDRTIGLDLIPGVGQGHSHERYEVQLQRINASPLADAVPVDGFVEFLAPTYDLAHANVLGGAGYLSVLQASAERNAYFGTDYADRIKASETVSLIADMGGGADELVGGAEGDILVGGSGNDNIAGKGGLDLLIGGGDGDRYHVGAFEGADTIDDRGGAGLDTLVLYTGNLASAFDNNWFTPDGLDLLVRVPNGSGGWAIDVRIKGMGTVAGAIETIELWAGDEELLTVDWNLAALWAEKAPAPTAPLSPPSIPDFSSDGAFTYLGDSASNIRMGDVNSDVMNGRAAWDILSGAGGADILLGGSGGAWTSADPLPISAGDELRGGDGSDLLIDDDGGSVLDADYLDGGDGDDQLVFHGAPEGFSDRGYGGAGADLALVNLADRAVGHHAIADNRPGHQLIVSLSDSGEENIYLHGFETIVVIFGSGNDTSNGGAERNYFDGGPGDDILYGGFGEDVLIGGEGDDSLIGEDWIYSVDGAADWMDGGPGLDYANIDLSEELRAVNFVLDGIVSSSGYTLIDGTFIKNVERFYLWSGSGDDELVVGLEMTGRAPPTFNSSSGWSAGGGRDRLSADFFGADEKVVLTIGDVGNELVVGLERLRFDDVEVFAVSGGSADDVLQAMDGDDDLEGNGGQDQLYSGRGDDRLDGGTGSDILVGGAGDDILIGGGGSSTAPDYMFGGTGDDTYTVNSGMTGPQDLVDEGEGNPALAGGASDVDTIISQGALFWDYYSVAERLIVDRDAGGQLVGGKNVMNKTITGDVGTDIILTYGRSSVVDAGGGTDAISFGLYGLDESYDGANTLVMKLGSGMDYLYEFESGVDKIDLSAFGYGLTGAQWDSFLVDVENGADDYCFLYLGQEGHYLVFVGTTSAQIAAGDFIG